MSVAERMRGLVEADPVVILEIAGAIANDGEGRWPPDDVTDAAGDHSGKLADADPVRLRVAMEHLLMGRDIDEALEWLQRVGGVKVLFPELEATVDLVQEEGRQHKDVWAHTKQVVKQTVRR
ncbi:MAG TPA: metal-dependent phosphohydrolase, partial [Kofleriaceae bacterium]|nr:metal-dependent phosphohydrolase [Kofleriaceae bacterium]